MAGDRVIRSREERMRGYERVLEARNRQTSPSRFRVLARDDIRPVRLWVARNPAAPGDVLEWLADDVDSTVQWNVMLNRSAPDVALQRLADREAAESGSRSFLVRSHVLHHPNVSDRLRRQLVADGACDCPRPCGRVNFDSYPFLGFLV